MDWLSKWVKALLCQILCSNKSSWEGEKLISDKNEHSEEHEETDEDDDIDAWIDSDGRFSFTRTVPNEVPMIRIQEEKCGYYSRWDGIRKINF